MLEAEIVYIERISVSKADGLRLCMVLLADGNDDSRCGSVTKVEGRTIMIEETNPDKATTEEVRSVRVGYTGRTSDSSELDVNIEDTKTSIVVVIPISWTVETIP